MAKNSLIDCIDALSQQTTTNKKWSIATALAQDLGFHSILVASANVQKSQVAWINTNMPDAWIEEYIACGYIAVDPLVQTFKDRRGSMTMESGQLNLNSDTPQKLIDLDYGLYANGLRTLRSSKFGAIADFGTNVTLCSEVPATVFEESAGIASQQFAALLAATFSDPIPSKANQLLAQEKLPQRQREVLSLLAEGYQTARIAEALGISEATVTKHFLSARQSLGAETREQALAIALQAGMISL